RQLAPAGPGQLDIVDHDCGRAGDPELDSHLQALFDSFPVQFGFHATTEAAFFQAEVVGVAGEGGRRVVGATPVQLGTVKFVVHGPVLVLTTRTTGGQGGGHGVLVLA